MSRLVHIGDAVRELHVRDRQLHAHLYTDGVSSVAPLEDLDVVIVDNQRGLTFDIHVLRSMLAEETTLIVSDAKHLPAGVLLPLAGSWRHTEVLHEQIEMSLPRKKRAWQQIVQCKIRAQASNLPAGIHRRRLELLALAVRSGDKGNLEAVAARAYWTTLFDTDFRRTSQSRQSENGALDYGYAVVRALLARSVVGVGLHPTLGFFHNSRQNPFNLVDDLVEPLRPAIDAIVLENREAVRRSLDIRLALIAVLDTTFRCGEHTGPLNHVTDKYALSVRKYISGMVDTIDIPVLSQMAPDDATTLFDE